LAKQHTCHDTSLGVGSDYPVDTCNMKEEEEEEPEEPREEIY
jgi:hypothetical protein